MCAGKEFARLRLQVVHLLFRLVGVVVFHLQLQPQPLVVVIHPVFRLRTARILIEQQQLRHHIGIIGNTVELLLVAVERTVHILHDVGDGVVAFRQFVAACNLRQLVEFLQILRLLGIVVVRQCNHKVIGIYRAEFGFAEVEEFLYVWNLPPHRLFDVERRFDGEESDTAEDGQHNRRNDNGTMVAYHKTAELFESFADISFKTLRHIGGRLAVLAERQQNGCEQQAGEQHGKQTERGVDADGSHRYYLHGQERHHGSHGGKSRQQHAPTGFAYGFLDGFPALACFYKLRLEEIVQVNVVGDGAGKSQYHGYHCRGHVDVDARPADDAETDEQSEHGREQWCNNAAQRTGYDEHHNDGDDEGKEEQPPQFAFEINEFLVAQIGHSRGVG